MLEMPVDIETLRLIELLLGVSVFALMYLGTYRISRAPYAGWWSGAMIAAGLGLFLHVVGDPGGSVVAAGGSALRVLGASCTWGAARSLHGKGTPWWYLIPAPLVIGGFTLAEQNDGIVYEDGFAQILGTGFFMTLTAWTLWRLLQGRALGRGVGSLHTARVAVTAVAVSSTLLAAFYAVRVLIHLADGTESTLYRIWLGPEAAVIGVIMWFAVIIYSVAELSNLENTLQWRERATRDELTGLLTRGAFTELAVERLVHEGGRGRRLMLIVADFDHFKRLNDTHGHAEGDRALRAFGAACRGLLREEDLAGRLGGEEFGLLLRAAHVDVAVSVCERVAAAVEREYGDEAITAPTMSFGVIVAEAGVPFDALLARADGALYRAKEEGRDRIVVDSLEA
ncbi:GGDEF domain-containing protein [Demequina sp. NBRC 110054]|uniref:GGDEF domain-containing protein n=1 Tax=Demequina sp. NBRC 110054 TaxID=1570343 RepID=UPI000A015D46|nr:GGDEF domain-containing protein [Demequina sp. NBRC 110054]